MCDLCDFLSLRLLYLDVDTAHVRLGCGYFEVW